MVNAGVSNGEIDRGHRRFLVEYVLTILVALTDGVSDDNERHQRTVDSIKMRLHGDLVKIASISG